MTATGPTGLEIHLLREDELPDADRILRLAFGTFRGLPNPMESMGDADHARTRWAADPASALAAELDGDLVGTNFVTRWGSVGFFGPLSVAPSLWDRGVGRALIRAAIALFDDWGVAHRGLFTFGDSPKHLALYQSFGFLPRFLTSILAKPVSDQAEGWTTFSALKDREQGLIGAAAVTGSIFEGLDVRREIQATFDQTLGDTVLINEGDDLVAFGVCHVGPGTEAGTDSCFVKFGAARGGRLGPSRFGRLLDACESFAATRGVSTITMGVSTGRRGAYRQLLDRGYRAERIGVTMHAPDVDAYHHSGSYVIDDWR
ncbi:MAG: GNAT family N-acetyltransferase [Acidimicrobiales bacterium]|nr:GNAT family N-acetyltransferase [Acidimicrobiales bacterium]MBO0886338.1 GNAT family N-acetyltransferase [Acidimicrobiales bacterium]